MEKKIGLPPFQQNSTFLSFWKWPCSYNSHVGLSQCQVPPKSHSFIIPLNYFFLGYPGIPMFSDNSKCITANTWAMGHTSTAGVSFGVRWRQQVFLILTTPKSDYPNHQVGSKSQFYMISCHIKNSIPYPIISHDTSHSVP